MVAGYLGGQWNELGGYYMVSQRMAHAWVELYEEKRGWVRVDPTPGGGPPRGGYPLWARLLDWMRFAWYQHVLEYNFLHQALLMREVEDCLNRELRLMHTLLYNPHLV